MLYPTELRAHWRLFLPNRSTGRSVPQLCACWAVLREPAAAVSLANVRPVGGAPRLHLQRILGETRCMDPLLTDPLCPKSMS